MSTLPRPAEVLPHRPPMILIDELLAMSESGLTARVRLRDDSPFVEEGQVSSLIAIEYMAQTISAWAAGRHQQAGGQGAKLGLLLGSRRYTAHCGTFPAGALLRIAARCEIIGDNGLGLFDCRIEMDGKEVATANVSVFEPEDASAFLKREASA